MLSVQCEPPVQTTFPSVHAFIMLEGTMNLTGEMQPLVEQLMMIKRIQVGNRTALAFCRFSQMFMRLGFLFQRVPAPLFVLEIWKACFTGLIESPEGTEELKWTAFTFLKVRSISILWLKYLRNVPRYGPDVLVDVHRFLRFC